LTTHLYTLKHTGTHCYTLQHLQHTAILHCGDTIIHSWQHTCTRWNTLEHTVAHCNTCNTLQYCIAETRLYILDNTLVHAATHCNTLHHTVTHCNTCNTLQHTATHCNAAVLRHDYTFSTRTVWSTCHLQTPLTQLPFWRECRLRDMRMELVPRCFNMCEYQKATHAHTHNSYIHMFDITHSCVWHDSCTCVPWLVHAKMGLVARHLCRNSFTCVTWLIHK